MKKIAVVDIETTGFQRQGGLIVEIAIVALDLETGMIHNEFDQVVQESGFGEKHTAHPYGWIFNNSDLTYQDVAAAQSLSNLLPEIQSVLNGYPLGATAYNKPFDFGFLRSRGLRFKELPCIMRAATPVVNLPPNPGYKDPKWPSVEEAWRYFFPDVLYKEAHRALDDARHEAMICYELYLRGKFAVDTVVAPSLWDL